MNLFLIFALAVVGLFLLGLAFRHAVRRGANISSQDEAGRDSIQAFDEGIQAA